MNASSRKSGRVGLAVHDSAVSLCTKAQTTARTVVTLLIEPWRDPYARARIAVGHHADEWALGVKTALAKHTGDKMDTNTLIIILLVVLLLGGGGYFYRSRV